MSEIYLKIYTTGGNTLVLEGQGEEGKDGYYPGVMNGSVKRTETTVCGREHIAITKDAKKAIRRIVHEANRSADGLSCLRIFHCYPRSGKHKEKINAGYSEVTFGYVGEPVTKWNIERIIKDNEFFIGCDEATLDLTILDELIELPSFYTCDPNYSQYNGLPFEIFSPLFGEKNTNDAVYRIKLQNDDFINAYGDELNNFIKEHEADPVVLPVTWEYCGEILSPASSIQSAVEKFNKEQDMISLPSGEYVSDSFRLTMDDPVDIAVFNYSFRDPERATKRDQYYRQSHQ